MQAGAWAGGLPPGFPGAPPGLPGLPGLPPGLAGLPSASQSQAVSAASLLAGMPPTSSSAAALAHMMAGARLPGPLPPGGMAELYAEKEKELAKLQALQAEDRNVSIVTRDT